MSESFDYRRYVEEDARLVVLRELRKQSDGRLNDAVLTRVIEDVGHTKSRDWLRTQLRKLEELGAVRLTEVSTVLIVAITRPGVEHVERRSLIEGIAKPAVGE